MRRSRPGRLRTGALLLATTVPAGMAVAVVVPGGPRARAQPFAGGGVITFGDAGYYGSPTDTMLTAPVTGMAATPDGRGYWLSAADGGVFAYGDAGYFGSAGGIDLDAPVIGVTGTPDGGGYWQLAMDGGIFSYGDAAFHGSTGNLILNRPVVGMTPTPTGKGYWLVAGDGGIFAFGDAQFYGSTGALKLNQPVVGMAATATGRGYWLVAGDGGVFPFGDAGFYGSAGGQPIAAGIVGLAPSPDGRGYTMAGGDGAIYTFGDARSFGSDAAVVPTPPITAFQVTPDGQGYWLLDRDAFATGFSRPAATVTNGVGPAIVRISAAEVGGDPDGGPFCNPYGPCEEWCSLFATWAWERAGVAIPHYPFTGDIWTWATQRGTALPPTARPAGGDLVLYGTGPANTATSVHVGIVAEVWPDGAITTVEGDAGPGPRGRGNVIINGPFLPSQSSSYNGFPIYGYAAP